jgi:group I intron endonuclease
MEFHYCYIITNLITGQQYVGDRSCFSEPDQDIYLGSGKDLKKAQKEYGKRKFKKEILEFFSTRQEAGNKQGFYIKLYKTHVSQGGYNIHWDGGTRNGERHHSKESNEKNRNSHLGKKESEETKYKKHLARLGEKNPMYGKRYQIQKAIDKAKQNAGKKIEEIFGEEKAKNIKEKMSLSTSGDKNGMFGKKHSKETLEKMKKPKNEEFKRKISLARLRSPKKRCEYCNNMFDPSNYSRWHGENCKNK